MIDQTVVCDVADGIAVVTLNRPEVLNALDEAMIDVLIDRLTSVADDPAVKAVVLTGAGRGFCAGMDLRDPRLLAENPPVDLGQRMASHYNPLVRMLAELPKPVVCAVNGVAAGGGANLALAGDIVVAGRSASFREVFSAIGLIPDLGGTWFLTRLLGPARARAVALLGETIGAEQAVEWGLIWACADDETLLADAKTLALRLGDLPWATVAAIRRGVASAALSSLSDQLDVELALQRELGFSSEFRRRVDDFVGKRR